MTTTNGTDWSVQGNAIIIYHQQEEAPLWLRISRADNLRGMLKESEGGE